MIFISRFFPIVVGAIFIIGLLKKEIEYEGWSNWSKRILLLASYWLNNSSVIIFYRKHSKYY